MTEFVDIAWMSILVPFVIGLIHYKRFSFALKILFFFVTYGTLNEAFGVVWRHLLDAKNTMPQSHFYLMVTFPLLLLFYRSVLKKWIKPVVFLVIIVGFETMCVVNLVFFRSIWEYPQWPQTISKLIYISFALVYLHKTMIEARIKN